VSSDCPKSASPGNPQSVVAGRPCNGHRRLHTGIADAFAQHKNFWLDTVTRRNLNVDGYTLLPEITAPDRRPKSVAVRTCAASVGQKPGVALAGAS
jgi:hypothetical protein